MTRTVVGSAATAAAMLAAIVTGRIVGATTATRRADVVAAANLANGIIGPATLADMTGRIVAPAALTDIAGRIVGTAACGGGVGHGEGSGRSSREQ